MRTLAYDEFHRIRKLSAFSVDKRAKATNVNQYVRAYLFPDGSTLRLFRSSSASVVNPNGDVVLVGQIRTNTFGS